jgi:hypothetical protein
MFQFPEFALPGLCIQPGVTPKGWVSPFRYLRIKAYCQLPEAFRRLSRLSSPVIAKASTTCTYSLDPITLSPHQNRFQFTVYSCLLAANWAFLTKRYIRFALNLCYIRTKRIRFRKGLCITCILNTGNLDTIKNPYASNSLFHLNTGINQYGHALRKPTTYYLLLPNF